MRGEADGEQVPTEPDEDGLLEVECDLRKAFGEESAERIILRGPVFHRVAFFWDDGKRRWLGNTPVMENGELDPTLAYPNLRDLARRSPLGTLEADLGELARVRLLHRHDGDPDELVSSVRRKLESVVSDVENLRGQYPMLRSLWLDWLFARFYHGTRDVKPEELRELVEGGSATVMLLEQWKRSAQGIVREPCRVVVLAPDEDSVARAGECGLHDLAMRACEKTKLERAVITDGLLWASHTMGRKVHPSPIDIRKAFAEEGGGTAGDFLYQFSITV
jgi:hypothetical protein